MRAVAFVVTLATAVVAGEREAAPCSPVEPSIDGRISIPEDGATGVPINARVIVEYDIDEIAFDSGLELRTSDGAVVVTSTQVSGSVRWRSFVLTPQADLASGTSYEIWDSTSVPCTPDDPDQPNPCRGPLIRVATFTTAEAVDVVAPTVASVTVSSGYSDPGNDTTCDFDGAQVIDVVTADGVEDDGPRHWIRFYYYDADGQVVAGPFPIGRVGRDCTGPFHTYYDVGIATDRFAIAAVDIAGNVSSPIAVDGMSCAEGARAEAGGCATGKPLDRVALCFAIMLCLDLSRRRGRRARTTAASSPS